jgi:alpha-tubulin suppressor-like RCC1 family protein
MGLNYTHNLAYINSTGGLNVSGSNYNGELGDDSVNENSITTNVITNVKDFIIGEHSLVLKNDNTLWVTGRNEYGELGLGDTYDRDSWTYVDVDNIKSIHAFGEKNFSILLLNTGRVLVAGAMGHDYGNANYMTFTDIGLENIDKIRAVTGDSVVFITNDKRAYVCGVNYSGKLGTGDTSNVNNPTLLQLTNIEDVMLCEDETFLFKIDGTILSAGSNNYYQLGVGDDVNRSTFTEAEIKAKVSKGEYNSYVLDVKFKEE